MLGYIVRRLVSAALVVVLTSMFLFLLFFKGPSDPARPLCDLNGKCTPEKLAILTEDLGLNDSVVHQYGIWAKGLVSDREIKFGATFTCEAPCLGISYRTRGEVRKELVEKLPATLSIAVGGATIYLVTGVLLGTIAARKRGTNMDRGLVAVSVFISAIPYYVVALLLWIFFSLQWKWFEDTSYHPLTEDPLAWAWALVLPWFAIGLTSSTAYARYSRGQMIEALGEDFVRTATAKGVSERAVVIRHALRAAIVPIITIFGLDFAFLLSGTVFTEQIFQIDGIGRWAIQSLRSPVDFPVVAATVLFAAIIVVVANLIVDILYSVIDPRVRLS
ncbi:ABC transporter permease [Nocardioides sp. R-C-SC26]|uniref:ABC transporter permease n=1 Tax=Nocardioides sp. R-C-SC26 TaxID=2870414 RepID=UPI001E308E99|nr:ABC transporter permease [Nocardioides sp. R-C-SC26]